MRIKHPKLTLAQYILRRTGLPLGSPGLLRSMLNRSFLARSPRDFWKYWNPIFGYYLGRYIYGPLKKIMPASLALILTFLFSGLIHDLATIIVKGSTRFLFTTWFFFLGTGVLWGGVVNVDLSQRSRVARIIFNLMYIIFSFALAYTLIITLGSI